MPASLSLPDGEDREVPFFTPEQAEAFKNAKPFPHLVVDGFWSDTELELCAAEFPDAHGNWTMYGDPRERGKRCMDNPAFWGPNVMQTMAHLSSPVMIQALEELTGLKGLTCDTIGGGMHMTGEGGLLDMHVDFNVHPDGQRLRRLNVLTFMNREWDSEWGGTLYLGENREVSVFPGWNRLVIFECSDVSWHGHPEPIVAGDHWRKSLAAYYYVPLDQPVSTRDTTWLS